MTVTYKLVEVFTGEKLIQRHNENGTITSIPNDPANSDYQAYLKRDEPQVEHLTEIPTN